MFELFKSINTAVTSNKIVMVTPYVHDVHIVANSQRGHPVSPPLAKDFLPSAFLPPVASFPALALAARRPARLHWLTLRQPPNDGEDSLARCADSQRTGETQIGIQQALAHTGSEA